MIRKRAIRCGGKRYLLPSLYIMILKHIILYGVTDCLELSRDDAGISVDGSEKKYHISIVEYKPTMPKNLEYRDDDLMQVFAQKVCVDYVFGGDCDGLIYYADVKKA